MSKAFQTQAHTYDTHARIQKTMYTKIMQMLPQRSYTTFAEFGVGTAWGTEKLIKEYPEAKFWLNDEAPAMLRIARQRCPTAHLLLGSFPQVKLTQSVDCIISCAMMQWIEDLTSAFHYFKNFVTSKGILAIGTFGPRMYQEIYQMGYPRLFYREKDTIRQLANSFGFRLLQYCRWEETLSFSHPIRVLRHMRDTGVNRVSESSVHCFHPKAFLQNYPQEIHDGCPSYPLTYHPQIFVWRKSE